MALQEQSSHRLPLFLLLLLCITLLQASFFNISSTTQPHGAPATRDVAANSDKNNKLTITPSIPLQESDFHHSRRDMQDKVVHVTESHIFARSDSEPGLEPNLEENPTDNQEDELLNTDQRELPQQQQQQRDGDVFLNGAMPGLSGWNDLTASSDSTTEDLNSDQDRNQDQEEQEDQQDEDQDQQYESLAQDPHQLEQKLIGGLYALRRDVKNATTICNSQTPQVLGPAWNGTFSSNSPDGVYPSETRSCTWTMQAMPGNTSSTTTGSPYIVSLNFWTPIQLVCGIDHLTLYDGPDTSSPVIAELCGNIYMDSTPTLYSSGPSMTAVFSTQSRTPGSFGFNAGWISVLPCNICLGTGRGTCDAGSCSCSSRFSGSVCQTETAGFKDFAPRSQHAMAYDTNRDMVYITGGTSFQIPYMYMEEVLTYSFGSNRWNKVTVKAKGPDPRYGHYSFMHKDDLYIYGGTTAYGGMADIWKFDVDSKHWTQQQPINPEQLPVGRRGAACIYVSNRNSTAKLYVFGGMNSAGETMRGLSVYDVDSAMWRKLDHQNAVGLSGATAIYHRATDSIYYFGGMVNQTTRNTVPYQYFIQQDLWYALAPRFDPLTATPVPSPYTIGDLPSVSPPPYRLNSSTVPEPDGEEDFGSLPSSGANGAQYITAQHFLPPVMYDAVSAVWAPAHMMDADKVVIFGGMRPFGLGVSVKDQSCYARTVSVYDLSCQNWTSYDVAKLSGETMKNRVNHTMVIRPPGASGGSKTAWTAYIFGGFDGAHRSDMLNITLNMPTKSPADINICRALRWCSMYDDCQNCNSNYCSYVNGLCLFDTDKARTSSAQSSAPDYLLGSSSDIPRNGTVQDLIRHRPDLEPQVLAGLETCPSRIGLSVGALYSNVIQPGQEMIFKTYIDAQDHDIVFEIHTNPATSPLEFKSLNVWEGFMNMYWRATHGLTDDSWDGTSGTSSPMPPDLPRQSSPRNNGTSPPDSAVISAAGTLNTTELMNRWDKYAGLDASPSWSALWYSVASTNVSFWAGDPRRFSGYYVYSIRNTNPIELPFTLKVTLVNHTADSDPPERSKFDLATLGFFMVGFILGVLLLIVVGRKIRSMLEERDHRRRAEAELRMFEEEEEEERRQLENNAIADPQSLKDMKPMYRVVVGIQKKQKEKWDVLGRSMLDSESNSLRRRAIRHSAPVNTSPSFHETRTRAATTESASISGNSAVVMTMVPPCSGSDSMILPEAEDEGHKRSSSTVPSDVIHDLGSLSPISKLGLSNTTSRTNSQDRPLSGLQRAWSLRSLGRSASFQRLFSRIKLSSEGKEGVADSCRSQMSMEDEPYRAHVVVEGDTLVGSSERDGNCQSVIELSALSQQQQHGSTLPPYIGEDGDIDLLETSANIGTRRNPSGVQPISIEPLPFLGGLVPRTRRHFKQYQRTLLMTRRQHDDENMLTRQRSTSYRSQMLVSTPRKNVVSNRQEQQQQQQQCKARRHQGSLHAARMAAVRMAARSGSDAGSKQGHRILKCRDQEQTKVKEEGATRIADRIVAIEDEPPLDAEEEGMNIDERRRSRRNMNIKDGQEYEPGPLLAVNVLIIFPGDARTRHVLKIGIDEEEDVGNAHVVEKEEQRLPPMAIGTVIVPDPARWWAYKAKQQADRRRFEREMRRLHKQKEQEQHYSERRVKP
ncbi:hypothetical protein BGX28_005843 [Mortierella sp. GBA30]|nr:hypothetical protein BGX28_005843 [Mortierella sp. GBA30]